MGVSVQKEQRCPIEWRTFCDTKTISLDILRKYERSDWLTELRSWHHCSEVLYSIGSLSSARFLLSLLILLLCDSSEYTPRQCFNPFTFLAFQFSFEAHSLTQLLDTILRSHQRRTTFPLQQNTDTFHHGWRQEEQGRGRSSIKQVSYAGIFSGAFVLSQDLVQVFAFIGTFGGFFALHTL